MRDGLFKVVTEDTGWSYIVGPDGYREGPIRYAWEAQEWADEMNRQEDAITS